MLSAPHRLRRSADFTLTVRKGARAGRSNLVVHCLLRQVDEPVRVGFTVGAGVGNSVVRHRISRQLREIIKPLLITVPAGTNIVVRALPGAATCGHEVLVAEVTAGLATALKKATP